MQKPGISFFQTINRFWWKAISIGITPELPLQEKKITRLLNIFAVTGVPGSLIFAIINFLQHRYPLAIINLFQALGAAFILIINKQRKYLVGRMALIILSLVLFSFSSLLYKNGAEYFLLLNIIVTVILFQNKSYVIAVAALNAIVFIAIKYLQVSTLVIEPLPTHRVFLNMGYTLLFIIIALNYFKTEHLKYQYQVEQSNETLQDQQAQLIKQKDELQHTTQQLQALNQTKEKLFSILAHDLRSPVGSLKITLDLYNNEYLTKEEFDELAPALTAQVDNLYNTLDNLLQWSMGQMGGIVVQAEVVHLKPLVLQTISLLSHNANQKHIQIEHNIPDHLYLYADPDHVKVVLRNLLANAIKFSHRKDRIEIGCMQQENIAKLFVKDYGVGMNATQLKTLFNSKGQSNNGTLNEKGTGLGLALCKEFIEKNNGSIEVVSKEGEGSTFIFQLPVRA